MPRGVRQVNVLDDGVLPQRGELEACGQALGVALGRLAIDHQTDPLLKFSAARSSRGSRPHSQGARR